MHSQVTVPGVLQTHVIINGASALQAEPLSCTGTPKKVILDHLTCYVKHVNHGAASAPAGDTP